MATRRQKEERRDRVSARRRIEEHKSGFTSTTFNRPDEMGLFQVKEECVKRIDILPYRVGKGNPYAQQGMLHFERTFFVHGRIGANENAYVCPRKTVDKPCPICEHRTKLAREVDHDPKLVKDLLPKERQLWIVKDYEDGKFYLWDCSFHIFGKLLDSRVKTADEDDDYEYFADLKEGLQLRLAFEEKPFPGGKPFYAVSSIDFKPRKESYDPSIVDELPCLDDLLIIKSYEELEKIYYQETDEDGVKDDDEEVRKPKTRSSADDDDEEDKPVRKSKVTRPVEDDDDDAPVREKTRAAVDDDDEEPVRKPKKSSPVDDDDEEEVCVACEGTGKNSKGRPCLVCKTAKPKAVESQADDEDDEEPVRKPKNTVVPVTKKPAKQVADDDDDVPFDDDEDEPPRKAKAKKAIPVDDDDDWDWDDDDK